jgi:hypothetical protein
MSNSDADYSNLSNTRDPVRFRRIPGRYRVNLVTRNGNRTHTHAFDARTLAQLRPDPRNPSQTLHPLTREPISRENLNRARRLAPGHAPPHNAHDNYSLARLSPSASFDRRRDAVYDRTMSLTGSALTGSASSSRSRSRHHMVLRPRRHRSPSHASPRR